MDNFGSLIELFFFENQRSVFYSIYGPAIRCNLFESFTAINTVIAKRNDMAIYFVRITKSIFAAVGFMI